MATWLKLSPHTHTGRRRPHEHTSYTALALLLFAVGIALSFYTAHAASLSWTRPLPASGSIGITGVMPGKPPTIAATIGPPADGQHFTSSPVTLSGTCPKDTLVEIFRNDIFAGSTVCDDNGKYTIEVDLLSGANAFIARVYDALNQAGPDSNKITVYFDFNAPIAKGATSLDAGAAPMVLITDAVYRGVFPNQPMSMPISILGGVPPYAINVLWGDTKNDLTSRADNQTFTVPHTYQKAGIYQIALQATDKQGRVAFLTVAAIVNGQPDVATTTGSGQSGSGSSNAIVAQLLALWPLYTAAVAMVISFWLGEKREMHTLAAHGQLLTP